MARFVVVEIPDNDEAEAFIKAIQEGYVMFSRPHPTLEGEVSVGKPITEWKVPQVYAVPTMFCECDKTYPEGKSQKFGWYVCTGPGCSKPRKGAMQHPYNLVEKDVPVTERVYYMGFRADRRGWRITKL
jgi:hypothetical protein